MFTGIVAAIGEICEVREVREGLESRDGRAVHDLRGTHDDSVAGVRLRIDAGTLDLADVAIGDSIAIQGACMTVVALDGNAFEVDVSRESLAATEGLDAPGPVNLEKALRLSDRLGGHLVSGHVDGRGEVMALAQRGESWLFEVKAPRALARYLAFKGLVAVNGVSLTVNRVVDLADGCTVSINLVPHTVAVTTLGRLRAGDAVNLEVDTVARYVERLHGVGQGQAAQEERRVSDDERTMEPD